MSYARISNDLVEYFQTHFVMEEGLMVTHKYPETAAHKAEHANFVSRVLAFKSRFEAGSVTQSIAILTYLKDWLINHIGATDKALVSHIKSQ
ncbi:MAG: hemerythrin family protein [Betaproteobacteria bacterium]|nr:hemerythrin family protein [Betaproteobacteria bacterium]